MKDRKSKPRRAAFNVHAEPMERRLLMSTYTVNTLSDAANPGAGLLTLRQAVADANTHAGADTINFNSRVFAPGSAHTIALTQGQIVFTDFGGATTVNGPGESVLTVNANGHSRIFKVSSGVTVSINAMTVTGGSFVAAPGQPAAGGGVLDNGHLSLNSVAVTNSKAIGGSETGLGNPLPGGVAQGGGIYSNGSLSLTNSAVTGNAATGGDVEDFVAGMGLGGGIYSSGPLTVTASTVSGNTATGGTTYDTVAGAAQGGAIFSSGSLTISADSIFGNSADGGGATGQFGSAPGQADGGAIYSAGSLKVNASTITGNTAHGGDPAGGYGSTGGSAEGGAIFTSGSWVVSNSILNNNAATAGIPQSIIGPAGGSAFGGAIYATQSASLNADTFDQDKALGGNTGFAGGGPAGKGGGGAIFTTAALSISNSSLSNNKAQGGSGPPDDNNPGAVGYGGAIDAGGALVITSSSLTTNEAVGGFSNSLGTNSANGYGGAIEAPKSLGLTSSTVSGNIAQGGAGGIYGGLGGNAEGGGIDVGGTAVITSSTISFNQALGGVGGSGNGSFAAGPGGVAFGGGICSGAVMTIVNSTIADNTARGGDGGRGPEDAGGPGGDGGDGWGSALWMDNSITVSDSTISGNATFGGVGGVAYSNYPAGSPGQGQAALVLSTNSTQFNNTIASHNLADNTTESDLAANLTNSHNNLIGTGGGIANGVNGNKVGITNPKLMPLGWYGGPTQTMLPMPGSPVINAGSNSFIPSGVKTDQRGFARIVGSSVDIGSVELGTTIITGSVFNDENADGKRQSNEPGVGESTIYLDLNHDGKFDAGDYSTLTNSSGQYTFDGLPAGSYTAAIVGMTNYRATTATSFKVSAGSNTTTVAAFGQTQDALISGSVINATTHAALSGFRVYLDLNNDGKWESTEPSHVTSSNGTWSFNIAVPGTYSVRIVPMAKYQTTSPTGGVFAFTVGKASARIGNVFAEQMVG